MSAMCTKCITQLPSYLHMSPHICVSVDVIWFFSSRLSPIYYFVHKDSNVIYIVYIGYIVHAIW